MGGASVVGTDGAGPTSVARAAGSGCGGAADDGGDRRVGVRRIAWALAVGGVGAAKAAVRRAATDGMSGSP